MGANINPDMKGYSGVEPFRFWCQTVLPLVYDDSLSYYELLSKVVFYLNKTIEDVANVEDNTTELFNAFNQLQEYVDNYFSSVNLQEEIDRKLDEMASDGTLALVIQPVVSAEVSTWLAQHIQPTTPAIDDSLSVYGAGADARTVGTAIYGSQNRDRSWLLGTRAIGLFKYSSDEFDAITQLQPWTYFFMGGAELQDILGARFTYSLEANKSYFVMRIGQQVIQNTSSMFIVSRMTGETVYIGYCIAGNDEPTAIVWNKWQIKPDTTLTQSGVAADASAVGSAIGDVMHIDKYCYTEFEYLDGWWNSSGVLSGSYKHSQYLRVNPGEKLYFGYTNTTTGVIGGFFDAGKNWIQPIRTSVYGATYDMQPYEYQIPDIDDETTGTYDELYYCTIPSGCYYVSLNLSTVDSRTYRQSIANFPCFPYYKANDFVSNEKRFDSKYKLGVIGPSSVVLDKLYRSTLGEYVRGFQEYLTPFYGEVNSFGINGGSWAKQAGLNIYDEIVTNEYDISGNDVFLLIGSSNDITSTTTGDATSADPTTYFGAINKTIDYIYSVSENVPKIFVVDLWHKGAYYTNTTVKNKTDEINAKYEQLAAYRSAELIKASAECGMNETTIDLYTYDGTHFNQEGNLMFGEYLRRKMVG